MSEFVLFKCRKYSDNGIWYNVNEQKDQNAVFFCFSLLIAATDTYSLLCCCLFSFFAGPQLQMTIAASRAAFTRSLQLFKNSQ